MTNESIVQDAKRSKKDDEDALVDNEEEEGKDDPNKPAAGTEMCCPLILCDLNILLCRN